MRVNSDAWNTWVLAHEFGYTFKEIAGLTPNQVTFLLAGLKRNTEKISRGKRVDEHYY